MRIVAFTAALALLLGAASAAVACEYKTANSGDVVTATGEPQGYPQSTPSDQGQPPG